MKTKNYAIEVENIGIGLRNLTGLSNAVYDSLYHGTFTPDAYEGAVFILVQETQRLSNLTEDIVKKMYEDVRHEK